MNPSLELLLSNLKQYADVMDRLYPKFPGKYSSIHRLIAERGIAFDRKIKSPFIGKHGECYKNCFQMSSSWTQPELYYCEGFANYGELKLPLPHAWLVNHQGEVIDPTWSKPESFIEPIYLGVVFDWDFVRKVAIESEIYGILDNDLFGNHQVKRLDLAAADLCPLFHN